MPEPPTPSRKLVYDHELPEKKGIRYSRSQLHRLRKAGKFAPLVKPSRGSPNASFDDEVDHYLALWARAGGGPVS